MFDYLFHLVGSDELLEVVQVKNKVVDDSCQELFQVNVDIDWQLVYLPEALHDFSSPLVASRERKFKKNLLQQGHAHRMEVKFGVREKLGPRDQGLDAI